MHYKKQVPSNQGRALTLGSAQKDKETVKGDAGYFPLF